MDDHPTKDTVDHSPCTRPLPGRRRPYCLYPPQHPRRHSVHAPESDGKPCVRFCKPRRRKAYTRTSLASRHIGMLIQPRSRVFWSRLPCATNPRPITMVLLSTWSSRRTPVAEWFTQTKWESNACCETTTWTKITHVRRHLRRRGWLI